MPVPDANPAPVRLAAPALAFLLLSGCSDDQPPTPTAEESDLLNEAEELLDNQSDGRSGTEVNEPTDANASGR